MNRNRNRNRNDTANTAVTGGILEPLEERAALYALRDEWMNLPLALPPSLPELRTQAVELLRKQVLLAQAPHAIRR